MATENGVADSSNTEHLIEQFRSGSEAIETGQLEILSDLFLKREKIPAISKHFDFKHLFYRLKTAQIKTVGQCETYALYLMFTDLDCNKPKNSFS